MGFSSLPSLSLPPRGQPTRAACRTTASGRSSLLDSRDCSLAENLHMAGSVCLWLPFIACLLVTAWLNRAAGSEARCTRSCGLVSGVGASAAPPLPLSAPFWPLPRFTFRRFLKGPSAFLFGFLTFFFLCCVYFRPSVMSSCTPCSKTPLSKCSTVPSRVKFFDKVPQSSKIVSKGKAC